MVQEVRSILFTAEECHAAVTTLLVMRVRGLRPEQVMGLELEKSASASATVRTDAGAEVTHVLTSEDLMSAVLLFCRRTHIPLSSRSHKRLTLIAGCLALTTSINLRAASPKVDGGTIVHALSGPDLTMLHTV